MSVINLSLPAGESVCNGKHISFAAPCACTGVTGVSIGGTTYNLVNADGNAYVSNGGSWASGAYLTIMLDCTNSKAYVVNDHAAGVFTAIYGTTTNAEIEAAYQAGKLIRVRMSNQRFGYLIFRGSATAHIFSGPTGAQYTCASDVWSQVQELCKTPEIGTINISTSWSGSGPYTQTVTVTGPSVSASSKVDIQPSSALVQQMISDGCSALYIENNNGTLTLTAVGASISVAQSNVQVCVTEVNT